MRFSPGFAFASAASCASSSAAYRAGGAALALEGGWDLGVALYEAQLQAEVAVGASVQVSSSTLQGLGAGGPRRPRTLEAFRCTREMCAPRDSATRRSGGAHGPVWALQLLANHT